MTGPDNLERFETLVGILARLRAPGGCPWDRKQTHATLRRHLLEECYETLEALDEGNARKLREELGDLLLQIVFHGQIAREAGEFDMADVIHDINAKLVHRHPHIFGSATANTAEEVAHNWEALKKEEREAGASVLAGLPENLPALAYAQSLQRRVAQAGFDWKSLDGALDKLAEEAAEVRQAASPEERAREFGDLLFALANVGGKLGVDVEAALRQANRRFRRRFEQMERLCRERGFNLDKMAFGDLMALWREAKKSAG